MSAVTDLRTELPVTSLCEAQGVSCASYYRRPRQASFRSRCDMAGHIRRLHANRGASVRSKPLARLSDDFQIQRSHSRSRVNNDKPYSESRFKAMKYSLSMVTSMNTTIRTTNSIGLWFCVVLCLSGPRHAGQSLLNTYATTCFVNGARHVVFVDTTTGRTNFTLLPSGIVPGHLVTRAKNGDLWIDDNNLQQVYRFSALGQLMATIPTTRKSGYLATNRAGNLLTIAVNSGSPPVPLSIELSEFSPTGVLLRSALVESILPTPFSSTAGGNYYSYVRNLFEDKLGYVWMSTSDTLHSIVRVAPDWLSAESWNLGSSWYIGLMPDRDQGVAIGYASNSGTITLPPGAPNEGTVGMDFQGNVSWISYTRVTGSRFDGSTSERVLFTSGTSYAGGAMRTRVYLTPTQCYGPACVLPPPVAQPTHYPFPSTGSVNGAPFCMGVDGEQDIWTVFRAPFSLLATAPLEMRLREVKGQPPYGLGMDVYLGSPANVAMISPSDTGDSTRIGQGTLHTLAMSNAPDEDFDGDGIPNLTELRSRSNPLDPRSPSVALVSWQPAFPGGVMTVNYQVFGEGGFPYFAPFAISNSPTLLLDGRSLPFSFQDALVLESLAPTILGIGGTLGYLDPSGQATTALALPAIPALSGFTLFSSLATMNPQDIGTPRSISQAFPLLIQ